MKLSFDRKKFVLYNYVIEEPILVAIASEYIPKIKHALATFGSFKDIPSDWEVRGIFLNAAMGGSLDSEAQQSEIIMNCLEKYDEPKSLS